ncbi:metal-dependent hydrolase family protein [Adlercreutzia agrestimuris]|uniref:metal-dependent hydrolase family protein n=1 Tax=Adlercreutzia agrestimuris TaxID=2941324 RepID=UPI002041C891|nr:amidohydrolase family protein [Adlercreutzia agrestimuris]
MAYAFTHVNILNGTLSPEGTMVPLMDQTVLINEEHIEAIYPSEANPTQNLCNYEVIDLQGKWMIPGLINAHAHLASSGKAPKKGSKPPNYKLLFAILSKIAPVRSFILKQQEKRAADELYSGVTTIRCVGGILDLDAKVRDKINKDIITGPRLLVCNTAVSVPGGHFAGSLATEAHSAQEAAEQTERIIATNPDWIKLMITGGVMDADKTGEPGVLRMPPELVEAACRVAHAQGFKVCAHVESSEGVRVALTHGVDTIEHGARTDDEIMQLFRDRHAALICTLSPAIPYALFPPEKSHCLPEAQINGKIVMEGIRDNAQACLDAGIPVGLGTDAGCPFITHYDMWRELVYFVRFCGVTPDFALYTATLKNAEILGIDEETGTIEVGKAADLIVCDTNPLEDLTRLRNLAFVVARGKVFANPKPRKILEVETALDEELYA